MKKLIALILILFVTNIYAQTEIGSYRIGGTADMSFVGVRPSAGFSTNQLNFQIEAGYFVANNLSLNFGLGYNFINSDKNVTIFTFLMGTRYCFPAKFFLEADFDIIGRKIEYYGGIGNENTGVRLLAGYSIFLNDKIAIEPIFGYRLNLRNEGGGTKFNTIIAQVGFSFYI